MFQEIRARAKEYSLLASVLALAGCASAPMREATPPPPSPEQVAMDRATRAFELGREAALSGDAACAADSFGRAIDALRPVGSLPTTDTRFRDFSEDLFEAILRYEALTAPAEEAGATEDRIAPELRQIEAPVSSPEEISRAASAVATDTTGVTYDIPIVVNESVLRILAVFQNDLREVIGRGLARSGRYVPMIHEIFREEGVPTDLAQVALIESSFLPRARSNKAAHGIWQFMLRTGRQYGLTANAVVDQRSDPEKATRAAARHLKYLNVLFHDWYLALAAYNAGEGKVLKAMARTGFSDFWQLAASGALKAQTVSYVPAVIAATLISKNPTHYGFDVEYEKPLEYETVELKRPVHLKHLADAERASFEELQRLNPELRTDVTPRDADGYELKVPIGAREVVLAAYTSAPTATPPMYRRLVARRGDTIARIARRFHVPMAVLAELNAVAPKARLPRGKVILIPKHEKLQVATGKKSKKKTNGKVVASVDRTQRPSPSEKKTYRVRGGDTLFRIALKHGTTVAMLMSTNSIGSPADIRPGDRLTIPAKR